MRKLVLATALAMVMGGGAAMAQAPAPVQQYGWKAQLDMMGCTGAGIARAVQGDFSGFTLPKSFGGAHRLPGEYEVAVVDADGTRRCVTGGRPSGPQF